MKHAWYRLNEGEREELSARIGNGDVVAHDDQERDSFSITLATGVLCVGSYGWEDADPTEWTLDITALKQYMNPATGSTDDYDGWWYEDEHGDQVNAVDRGEVVEVVKGITGEWVEASTSQAAAALGRIRSEKKAAASRLNGAKGGRPKNDH